MMETIIPVENKNLLAAIRSLLGQFLTSGLVEALYVPLETGTGMVQPALVTDPARLALANPLAPVMPINGARAVAALTGKSAPHRFGAVLRACEIRALVELEKLQQASLENLVIIGLDCPGSVEIPVWQQAGSQNGDYFTGLLAVAQNDSQEGGVSLRPACRMCVQPVPQGADVHLRFFGQDAAAGILASVSEEIVQDLHLQPIAGDGLATWQAALDHLLANRQAARAREFASVRSSLNANGGLAAQFSACLRCHNCSVACPLCYCKTCLFRSPAFDHPPEHYFETARHKGALRLLGDALLFHLTRLHHMGLSCVSCGMCTSACPVDIPVGLIFSSISENLQTAFQYAPGRDPEEVLPLITFQVDEWVEYGEP